MLLGIVALAGIVVVVLTSTDWGHERVRRIALSQLQSHVHGRVSIGRLSGNLLIGLTIHDLAISDSSGEPFLAAQEASARYALGALIIGKKIWLQDVRLVAAPDRARPTARRKVELPAHLRVRHDAAGVDQAGLRQLDPSRERDGRGRRSPRAHAVVAGNAAARQRHAIRRFATPSPERAGRWSSRASHAYGGAPPYQKIVELRSMNASLPDAAACRSEPEESLRARWRRCR